MSNSNTLLKSVTLNDYEQIHSFLRKDAGLYLYQTGDLDEFFRPFTKWYGLERDGELKEIVLLYSGQEIATLIALSGNISEMEILLTQIKTELPDRFYTHLTPGLENSFRDDFKLRPHGEHLRMMLTDRSIINDIDTGNVEKLEETDLELIYQLYEENYKENWFDPRMLKTGQYFGIKKTDRLISIAGIIGVGKTTLTECLSKVWNCHKLLERLHYTFESILHHARTSNLNDRNEY